MCLIVMRMDTTPLRNPDLFRYYLQQMPSQRRQKIDRLKNPSAQFLSLGAGIIFQKALGSLNLFGLDKTIQVDENGKPFFPDSNYFFNLSHSGTEVMCVIDSSPCGCDVQQIVDLDYMSLSKRFFTSEELISCCSMFKENNLKAFYRIWVRKESLAKCSGKGLMKSLSCYPVQSSPIVIDGISYYFKEYTGLDSYCYAICTTHPISADIVNCSI